MMRTAFTYLSGISTCAVAWVIFGLDSKSQFSENSSKDFMVPYSSGNDCDIGRTRGFACSDISCWDQRASFQGSESRHSLDEVIDPTGSKFRSESNIFHSVGR
ncbi:uncharacterized protein [Montipora capricornis]|uniref:uncharacterized protein isoform X3 n=1 Tax=Montipora capricornis TaxID=246305 RepID=UPI0035F1FA7D